MVRVDSVGICCTDVSIHSGKIPVDYPRILVHEIVGIVENYGEGPAANDVAVGGKVIVDPGIACGVCRQCREGRSNICTRGWLLGRDMDGGASGAARRAGVERPPAPRRDRCVRRPLLQVLATCVHAQRRISIFPGESVVVLGLGVTGLLHVQRRAADVLQVVHERVVVRVHQVLRVTEGVVADHTDPVDEPLQASAGLDDRSEVVVHVERATLAGVEPHLEDPDVVVLEPERGPDLPVRTGRAAPPRSPRPRTSPALLPARRCSASAASDRRVRT